MQPDMHQPPINPLPAVVWALALPMIAAEAAIGLGSLGFLGGIGMRNTLMQQAAFAPEMVQRMWDVGAVNWGQARRLLSYPFVHTSLTHAALVLAFTLALGKMVAANFRPWALLAIFFGAAVGGALVYTAVAAQIPGRHAPLIGGYPAVYGLVGAFTFLLWTRLAAQNANRLRAFTLIGFLLGFQLIFGVLVGTRGFDWVAEVSGFAIGFALSFLLIEGGPERALAAIRRR